MSRAINRLTVRRAETLSKPGLHPDGGGLYLRVGKRKVNAAKSNARSWVFLYRRKKERFELGLGSFSVVGLAEARELAAACRKRLHAGEKLVEGWRKKPSVPTFGEVADEYIAAHEGSWSNLKHRAQWQMTLREYAAPLRAIPVNEVTVEDVRAVLAPHWQRAPETAGRLRARIEAVLAAAKAKKLRSGENPAAWQDNLKHLLPARATLSRGHHRSLPFTELFAFMERLRTREGIAARALEYTILTAGRSNEVRSAVWDEIDMDAKVWSVPALRMKARREHRVPLSKRALVILEKLHQNGRDGLIFPSQGRCSPLSDSSLSAVLDRLGVDATVHGFRSSFKDWARECTTFANELSEAALAHVIRDKVQAAYARGDLLERRRELMEAWASYLDGHAETVRLLRRA
jgi:integrase